MSIIDLEKFQVFLSSNISSVQFLSLLISNYIHIELVHIVSIGCSTFKDVTPSLLSCFSFPAFQYDLFIHFSFLKLFDHRYCLPFSLELKHILSVIINFLLDSSNISVILKSGYVNCFVS